MSLTKEDLLAIKGIVDDSVKDMKSDIVDLKSDVADLKTDVAGLKTDVSGLKADMSSVKDRLTNIEVVQLENYLIPKVEEIAKYQKDTYDRFVAATELFEKKSALIDATAQVVIRHSAEIKELQMKQA